jgi:hypothetical protein
MVRPDETSWENFFNLKLLWPLVVQAIITVACLPLHAIYRRLYHNVGVFHRFIDRYVGRTGRLYIECPFVFTLFQLLQVVGSFIEVGIYAAASYDNSAEHFGTLQSVLAILFVCIYLLNMLQGRFHVKAAWFIPSLVDVFTIVPLCVHAPITVRWLDLRFLRAYSAMLAYEYIQNVDFVKAQVPEFQRRLALTVLRLICLVICMSGTILTLEVLGELPGWEPKGVATAMGDLSFIQMFYWMITTISTVGYGDYSPTTIPSQLVIVVFIIGGVMVFGVETGDLLELKLMVDNGRGAYIPPKKYDRHIILTGSGASRLSSMLETFLLEVLDPQGSADVPNVVILSEAEYDPALKAFVQMKLPARGDQKVFFLRGSALSAGDLERVQLQRATMAFVLPGVTEGSADGTEEDNQSILRTLEMQRHFPGLRLRLMLLESGSEERAVLLGVPRQQCFTANGIKAGMLAHSARVKGLMTLVAGLLQVTTEDEINAFLSGSSKQECIWRNEYSHSVKKQVYGCVINGASPIPLVGLPFATAAAKLYQESKDKVMLLAAQVNGRLMLNWNGSLEEGQVVMVIANSLPELTPFMSHGGSVVDWRQPFLHKRGAMLNKERLEMLEHEKRDGADTAVVQVSGKPLRLSSAGLHEELTKVEPKDGSAESTFDAVALVQKLKLSPDLIVLIVAGGSNAAWDQANMFIASLRQEYFKSMHQPIIVLSPGEAPASLQDRFEDCAFATGKVLSSHSLKMVGVDVAQAVVIFRGGTWQGFNASHIVMEDYEIITLTNLIAKICKSSERGDRYMLYEFGSTLAAQLREERDAGKTAADEDEDDNVAKVSSGYLGPLYRSLFDSTSELRQTLSKQLLLLPSFASGQAFSPDFFGSVLGHIYNFPATIEFIETICAPQHNMQTSVAWQVKCPPHWVNKTFGELLRSWANGQDESGLLQESGPVLAIALYRNNGSGGLGTMCSLGYNVTLPEGSTRLAQSDLITLLGPPSFAKAAVDRSLLRSAAAGPLAPAVPGRTN